MSTRKFYLTEADQVVFFDGHRRLGHVASVMNERTAIPSDITREAQAWWRGELAPYKPQTQTTGCGDWQQDAEAISILAQGDDADAMNVSKPLPKSCGLLTRAADPHAFFIAYPPGHRLGLISNQPTMAWRPYENLIDGELDNHTPGKVVGWMRFYRQGIAPLKVVFYLEGDFHEDIRGKKIRLSNPQPSDRNQQLDREGTYMEGFCAMQRGTAGDITAGLPLGTWTEELAQKLMAQHELTWQEKLVPEHEREERRRELAAAYRTHIEAQDPSFAYVGYPYIEWYSDNGRVVLELDPSQVEIVDTQGADPRRVKTQAELADDQKKRDQAFNDYMSGMVKDLSDENRSKGGDSNVTGIVVR